MSPNRNAPAAPAGFAAVLVPVALATLVSCGGGDAGTPAATPEKETLRMRALASAPAPALDADTLFGWAEMKFPELFPAGPHDESVDYQGRRYTIRYYAGTGNYLGVTGDEVYGLGSFTGWTLIGYGRLGDWRCQLLGQTCLSGVVARSAALAGATVDAKCLAAAGDGVVSASTLTDSEGRYSLAVEASRLPCVLRAVPSDDGPVQHSVATGSGSGTRNTVHLTPMTRLVTAYLTGVLPGEFYESFSAADAARLGAAAASAAQASVVATIKSAGVDFSAAGDVLAGALVPGEGGNAHGQALARLDAKITGGLTQARLADAITRTTEAAKAAGVPSLPAELLLRPAARNCAALRSGPIRAVFTNRDNRSALLNFDAQTLTLSAGAATFATLVPDGNCHYRTADGREFVVSDAGVIVGRTGTGDGKLRAMLAFPEQAHPLAAAVGDRQSLSFELDEGVPGAVHLTFTNFDEGGRMVAVTYCDKDAGKLASDCISGTLQGGIFGGRRFPEVTLSANPSGGFVVTNVTDGWSSPLFLYRSGSGHWLSAGGGTVSISIVSRSATLPAVGLVRESWNTTIANDYTARQAMSQSKSTVTAVDAATGTFTRASVINFSTGATRPERIEINRFRDGFGHRIPETVTGSDGSVQNVGEFVLLRPDGMGFAAVGHLGSTQSFTLSVDKSTAP